MAIPRSSLENAFFGPHAQKPQTNPRRHCGRNAPCPCGSGRKYKKCCLERDKRESEHDSCGQVIADRNRDLGY
jgi:hypothetical protein